MKTENEAWAAFACIVIWFAIFFYVVNMTSTEKTLSCSPDYKGPDSMVVVCK
jgi:hypothetical protein